MFPSEKIQTYLLLLAVAVVSGYIMNKFAVDYHTSDDYEIIRKYLLNDSPLYGYNRPKIWIHSTYEINARKWKDFQSRNTTDLNQPYIYSTIKTIINHCGTDFNVCLIDDQSFSKLLPSWDVDLSTMAEPMKTRFRELAMLELLYYYGGMIVPNSFLCKKNLIDFYKDSLSEDKPFVCENISHSYNQFKYKHKKLFAPDVFFMGANKNDKTLLVLIEFLKKRNRNPHFTSEREFNGDTSVACLTLIEENKMNLISASFIGVKNNHNQPILLDELLGENYLDLPDESVGIYIPADEILNRPKYQWFAYLSTEEILQSRIIIAKYLKASLIDTNDEYSKSGTIRSVVSI
jgi:hypothetical protein